MLTYALVLGMTGQLAEAQAWVQRARARIGDEPEARAQDVATLDAVRLLMFTVTAGAGDEIDAGRRAVEAVEAGLDLGPIGVRARMNLVRGYLLVDEPDQAGAVLGPAARAMRSRRLCSRRRWPRASRCGRAGSVKPNVRLRLLCRPLTRSAWTPTGARGRPIWCWREFSLTVTSSRTRLGRSGVWTRSSWPTRLPGSTGSCSGSRRHGWPPRWTISTTCSLPCRGRQAHRPYPAVGLAAPGRCGCRPLAPAGGPGTPG